MRSICTAGLLLAAAAAGFGQSVPARPEFEVASVKPSPRTTEALVNVGVHVDGAQVHIASVSMKDYIRIAYQVKEYQVSGPEWLASERYDIDATLPAGAARRQVPEMLQALLADRFRMKMHRDSKEFPVYGLVVAGGGPKMKGSPPDAQGGPGDAGKAVEVTASGGRGGVSINYGSGSYFSFGNNRIEAGKMTMANFADSLGRFADRPVVDMTKLEGKYDFTIELTPEDYRAMLIRSAVAAGMTLPPEALRALEGATDDSLFTAVRGLGLKLEPRKAPLDVVVIDQIQKTPTEN